MPTVTIQQEAKLLGGYCPLQEARTEEEMEWLGRQGVKNLACSEISPRAGALVSQVLGHMDVRLIWMQNTRFPGCLCLRERPVSPPLYLDSK